MQGDKRMSDKRYVQKPKPFEIRGLPGGYTIAMWVAWLADKCAKPGTMAEVRRNIAVVSAFEDDSPLAVLTEANWTWIKTLADDPGKVGYPTLTGTRKDGEEVTIELPLVVHEQFGTSIINAATSPPACVKLPEETKEPATDEAAEKEAAQ
jgi:hypothetical protein